ncbi:cell wall anchor protein [Flavobacterium psychrophilum]
MEKFLYQILTVFFVGLITWFFARRKNNAEAKTVEIETEIKAADFYRTLLDDAMKRLDLAIKTIHEQDVRIKELMLEVETLTHHEIRKYKQLNGKAE